MIILWPTCFMFCKVQSIMAHYCLDVFWYFLCRNHRKHSNLTFNPLFVEGIFANKSLNIRHHQTHNKQLFWTQLNFRVLTENVSGWKGWAIGRRQGPYSKKDNFYIFLDKYFSLMQPTTNFFKQFQSFPPYFMDLAKTGSNK